MRQAGKPDLLAGEREGRLAFDDRVVVWEGVEGLNAEDAVARLEIDVAHRAEAEAAAGIEAVEQALSGAGLGELFLIGPEGFFVDGLEREGGLVSDAAAAFDGIAGRAFEAMGHEAAPLGERMIGGGSDFGERDALILPGDDVAGGRDLDVGPVAAAFDLPRIVDFEQFGMERTTVELEHQFSDLRANG